MSTQRRAIIGVGVFLLVLTALGCGKKDKIDLSSFPEPPPPPQGYASADEVLAAALSGKIALIPDSPPIPDSVREVKDIEYGNADGHALLLDLYLPKDARKPVPGLIFVHGGGWKGGNRRDYLPYTIRFAERGYAAATISYRLVKDATFPGCVQDAKCAVRWMRAKGGEYGIDPDNIAILGGSAGGYLSMMVGYTPEVAPLGGAGGHEEVSSRVQAVVNLYGPTDLAAEIARTSPEVLNFIGKPYEEAPNLYVEASPITYVSADDPPTLVFHGTVDDIVPVEQADLLVAKLKEMNVPVIYDRVEGWPHTMDKAQVINERCCFFLDNFFERVFR